MYGTMFVRGQVFVRGLHWIAIERNNDVSQQEDYFTI